MGFEDDEDETTGGFRGPYGFLSNMHPCSCVHEGIEFASSEHLYQWLKVPDTPEGRPWRDRIRAAEDGRLAKKIAASPACPKPPGLGSSEWDALRLRAMEVALRSKFADGELRSRLVGTGSTALVEHNHWRDVFWGVCGGLGRNELGGMLMRLRMEFAAEAEPRLAGPGRKP